MTFRPVDHTLLGTCENQADCLDCPMRIGCPIRYSFYQTRTFKQFEITLSRASNLSSNISPDKLKQLASQMKHKWMVERLNHPKGYQYNG